MYDQGVVVHICEDPTDHTCCEECCGVGSGGCWCDHDCDALCIDSCPLWLRARAAERRRR